MIFPQPNLLPTSILKKIYAGKEHIRTETAYFQEKAVEKLRSVALYGGVKDRLLKTALSLPGGQQQRLCVARTLMLEPEIMLFDEPCSPPDPIATYTIVDMLVEPKETRTVIIVTHNMEQARRISDYTAFFYQSEIIKTGKATDLFSNRKPELLGRYIMGRFWFYSRLLGKRMVVCVTDEGR